jgi:hypothetical protein
MFVSAWPSFIFRASPREDRQKIEAQDACERFYKPVRGCETCRICNDRDFCNDLHVEKTEAGNIEFELVEIG